jgi:hypothetical protein
LFEHLVFLSQLHVDAAEVLVVEHQFIDLRGVEIALFGELMFHLVQLPSLMT